MEPFDPPTLSHRPKSFRTSYNITTVQVRHLLSILTTPTHSPAKHSIFHIELDLHRPQIPGRTMRVKVPTILRNEIRLDQEAALPTVDWLAAKKPGGIAVMSTVPSRNGTDCRTVPISSVPRAALDDPTDVRYALASLLNWLSFKGTISLSHSVLTMAWDDVADATFESIGHAIQLVAMAYDERADVAQGREAFSIKIKCNDKCVCGLAGVEVMMVPYLIGASLEAGKVKTKAVAKRCGCRKKPTRTVEILQIGELVHLEIKGRDAASIGWNKASVVVNGAYYDISPVTFLVAAPNEDDIVEYDVSVFEQGVRDLAGSPRPTKYEDKATHVFYRVVAIDGIEQLPQVDASVQAKPAANDRDDLHRAGSERTLAPVAEFFARPDPVVVEPPHPHILDPKRAWLGMSIGGTVPFRGFPNIGWFDINTLLLLMYRLERSLQRHASFLSISSGFITLLPSVQASGDDLIDKPTMPDPRRTNAITDKVSWEQNLYTRLSHILPADSDAASRLTSVCVVLRHGDPDARRHVGAVFAARRLAAPRDPGAARYGADVGRRGQGGPAVRAPRGPQARVGGHVDRHDQDSAGPPDPELARRQHPRPGYGPRRAQAASTRLDPFGLADEGLAAVDRRRGLHARRQADRRAGHQISHRRDSWRGGAGHLDTWPRHRTLRPLARIAHADRTAPAHQRYSRRCRACPRPRP